MLVVLLLLPTGAVGDVAGPRGGVVAYRGLHEIPPGSGRGLSFEIDVDPVIFLATSVGGRYRLLRVRVRHDGPDDVPLGDGDAFRALLDDGRGVDGILDMQAADAAVWDGLTASERRALAYPLALRAPPGSHGPAASTHFFVFFPASLDEVPRSFEYVLSGPGITVSIERPPETAARN